MVLSNQELSNKLEGQKLLRLPSKDRPENVFYTPCTSEVPASYRVVFGTTVVCFHFVPKENKGVVYLGERPLGDFDDLVAYYEDDENEKLDAIFCKSCGMSDPDVRETNEGPHCLTCRYEMFLVAVGHGEPGPVLDTCDLCMTVMEVAAGCKTDEGFRCFKCQKSVNESRHERAYQLLQRDALAELSTCIHCNELFLAEGGSETDEGFQCFDCQKDDASVYATCIECDEEMYPGHGSQIDEGFKCFKCQGLWKNPDNHKRLTEAIEIIQAAFQGAYPVTKSHEHDLTFGNGSQTIITKFTRNDHGQQISSGGFVNAEALALDLIHRAVAIEEYAANELGFTGWAEGAVYRDLSPQETLGSQYELDEAYSYLTPVVSFVAADRPKTLAVVPCTEDGRVHPLWDKQFMNPVYVHVSAIILDYADV